MFGAGAEIQRRAGGRLNRGNDSGSHREAPSATSVRPLQSARFLCTSFSLSIKLRLTRELPGADPIGLF